MSHQRADSKMVHSSRRSYKDKLAKLQASTLQTRDDTIETLQIQGDINVLLQQVQDESHKLATRVATQAQEAVKEADALSSCEGLKFPLVKRAIDDSLLNMNVDIMLRRSSDIIRVLSERIGILTEAYNNARRDLDAIQTETILLKSPIRRIREKHVETYGIGRRPTDIEKQDYENNEGKFDRFGLEYFTDPDDSDSEGSDEDESNAGSYALALRN